MGCAPAARAGALTKSRSAAAYWHEKLVKNPPPPAAVCVLVASVIIVPALTVLPAVAVHVLPPVAAVVQEIIELPTVHVAEAVLGVTAKMSQVVEAPA